MNSSDDATPDYSPPYSPLPILPPPKAKRKPAARPRKPQPGPPNDIVLKIKPPVTKPRSSANVLPRKRTFQTERLPVEEHFVEDTELRRYYVKEPPTEKHRIKKPRVEKPVPVVQDIDLDRHYVEEPPAEKPRIKKARVEKPVPFVDEYDIERHFVEELQPEKPRVKKPRVEKPVGEKPSRIEKTRVEKPQIEKPRVEKLHLEKHPRIEKLHVEKPRVEKSKTEQLPVEKLRIEQPRIEQPHLDQHPKKPKGKLPKAAAVVVFKPPKQAKQKVVPVQEQYPGLDWEVQESQFDRNLALQQNYDRQRVQQAAKQLEDLVEATSAMIDEMHMEDDEVDRLEEEKSRLLDELLVREGLIDNLYPAYNPYRSFIPVPPTKKKFKRVRKATAPSTN